MKKTPLLNTALSEVIAGLGHKDMVLIGDAGMPIPERPRRIDLALTQGVPGFLETLRVVTLEMQVESIVLAEELEAASPQIFWHPRNIAGGPYPVDPPRGTQEIIWTGAGRCTDG